MASVQRGNVLLKIDRTIYMSSLLIRSCALYLLIPARIRPLYQQLTDDVAEPYNTPTRDDGGRLSPCQCLVLGNAMVLHIEETHIISIHKYVHELDGSS